MKQRRVIGSVKTYPTAKYLAASAALVVLLAVLMIDAIGRALDGRFSYWSAGAFFAAILAARGLHGQWLIFHALLKPDRGLLTVEDSNLIYGGRAYSMLSLPDVSSMGVERLRRGFGLQDYIVVRTSDGAAMYVHAGILSEGADNVMAEISRLSPNLGRAQEGARPA